MFGIGEYFKKIKGSFGREIAIRAAIKQSVKKLTGVDLKIEEIKVKNRQITLSGINQAARSAIFIKKSAILAEINKTDLLSGITDIR